MASQLLKRIINGSTLCTSMYAVMSSRQKLYPSTAFIFSCAAVVLPSGQVGRSLSEGEAAHLSGEQREQLSRLKQQAVRSGGTAVGGFNPPFY